MGYQPSVRDVILAFFRRRTLFMLVCGAVFLTGGAYLLLKQPLYQSTASLVLHFDTQAVPNIDRTMNRLSRWARTNTARSCIPTPRSCAAPV